MSTIFEEIKKLSVADRADLLLALKNDSELNQYLKTEKSEIEIIEEIGKRDKSFKNGDIHLTTIDDLSTRLKARRNAL